MTNGNGNGTNGHYHQSYDAPKMKKVEPVSKIYARALYELAKEKSALEEVEKQFIEMSVVARENELLIHTLESFTFSLEDRQKLWKSFASKAQLNSLLTNFVSLLISKNRLRILPQILEAFRQLLDQGRNIVRGTVTTVEPLSDGEIDGLNKAFSRRFSKQVHLEAKTDQSILGGLVVQVQGLTFDGSLRATIDHLKENLERHAL